MGWRRRGDPEATIRNRIREGRGTGVGREYKPWLKVREVPSKGLETREMGWKTHRMHHLLSELERRYFCVLEWSSQVVDIREQYPLLPREETLAIAEAIGVRHPMVPHTTVPIVMTSDFMITVRQPVGVRNQVRTTKYVSELACWRKMEKLQIERLYWEARGLDWGIVTERDIPWTLADNVDWMHPHKNLADMAPLSFDDIRRIATVLAPRVMDSDVPLARLTDECDDRLGLEPGCSLMAVRHLLANRVWVVDMSKKINVSEPLRPLSVSSAIPSLQRSA